MDESPVAQLLQHARAAAAAHQAAADNARAIALEAEHNRPGRQPDGHQAPPDAGQ